MGEIVPLYTSLWHQAGKLIVEAIRRELRLQGHSGTGLLIDSIEYVIHHEFDDILQVYADYYGKYVNFGVKPDRVPYSPRQKGEAPRGGVSKYIEALEKYVLENGFVASLKDAKSMAFAIAAKHKKEGMPTRDSYKHSVTGKRTEFIEDAIDGISEQLNDLIYEIIGREMQVIFQDILNVA